MIFLVVKNTTASVTSTLQIMISEDIRLNNMKHYMSNLQQLHQSQTDSINLHAFINDLLIIVQRLLENVDSRQWQAAINNCITIQCPWFKPSNLSSNNTTLYCSTTNTSINNSNTFLNRCLSSPSIDHTYSFNNERLLFESNTYKNNLLTSSDSLLRFMNNKIENQYSFDTLYQIDTRLCKLCQTYADNYSSTISRLISIGIDQWVHVGCILPAYTKTLDQSPYILRNIHEIINRCQMKYKCEICSKFGASIQCCENDCNARFHNQCIEMFYSKIDGCLKEKFNIANGLLPNLSTLCPKHCKKRMKINGEESNDRIEGVLDDISLPKFKSINLSSTVYADLSNTLIEFCLSDIKLSIGSLQIQSLGDFDYLLDNDSNSDLYPNNYHASRIFWSTKNAQQKTVYHLHIDIEQTYHNDKINHQTIEYPLSSQQILLDNLYETCEKYFNRFQNKDNFRNKSIPSNIENPSLSIKNPTSKLIPKSSIRSKPKFNNNENNLQLNKSLLSQSEEKRFALALVQALQNVDPSIHKQQQEPIFSYYISSPNERIASPIPVVNNLTETWIPQVDGNVDHDDEDLLVSSSLINCLIERIQNEKSSSYQISSNELIRLYKQWLTTKFGRVKFTIISDDGYRIVSENLDEAWLSIVNQVRECRDDMNLTHLPMRNEELNGHQIFGLTKSIVKIMLNQLYLNSSQIERPRDTILLPLSSSNKNSTIGFIKKKNSNKKVVSSTSRLNIYQRKNSQRQRFNWLLNPNRKVEYALKSFEIDEALAYAR